MAVATGTALALGAMGLSAGANAYSAHRGANAARDAARTQSQSADRAMDVQRQIYQQQRQMVDPYLQAGTQSLAAMMQQYGNAGLPMPGAPQRPQYQPMQPGGFRPPSPTMAAPPQVQTMGSLASMGRPQAVPRAPGPTRGGGEMVLMTSPDGSETVPVPAHMVAQVEAAGGRRVG